jgi:ATP-dependent DNA ligase
MSPIYFGRGLRRETRQRDYVMHFAASGAEAMDRLAIPSPRGTRFGSPLVLNRVHWVRPEMVVEVTYVEWTPDGLLRHVVYLGERENKAATEVRRSRPHAGEP